MRWLKRRRKALVHDIAVEVIRQLESQRGWKKFLPPVAMRDTVYMVTEDGEVWAMKWNDLTNMECIMRIRS